jgi:hypothetical protein
VPPEELKRDLDEQFREKFPHVQLTLSKLREYKLQIVRVTQECALSLSTAALAQAYFEYLLNKERVRKAQMETHVAACLLLATKFNENKDEIEMLVPEMLKSAEDVWGVAPRDVTEVEFEVFVYLDFSLSVADRLITANLRRILTAMPEHERPTDEDFDFGALYC